METLQNSYRAFRIGFAAGCVAVALHRHAVEIRKRGFARGSGFALLFGTKAERGAEPLRQRVRAARHSLASHPPAEPMRISPS